ncbi:MAG TPA: protease modulator HflC [Phycisphaerae bacterium]|nr:protease modulator HflC [Phycisphaerae bacterium]
MKSVTVVAIIVVLALILLRASAYTVNEAEQVIITQFGDPKDVVPDPGLHFRSPFVQQVQRLEKRLLPWDGDPENMVTKDKKNIFIDVWARWRIVDPLQFYKACRTVNGGQGILDDLVDSSVRDVIASHNLIECVRSSNDELQYEDEVFEAERERHQELISVGRGDLEKQMLASVNASADLKATYGMEVTEVHIKRVNYVENVRDRVYERMKSERTRIASLFESEAQEERNRILGNTRKELDEIEGEMEQRAAEIRGDADAEVIKIYADALSQDPDFFLFMRQLEAYKATFDDQTRLILSTDNEFLNLLRGPTPQETQQKD